ncbi:MAG TPA: protein kinase [Gemmataceae bacterium]|nr:protein kinase [Gemmataceae bacterium]
MPDLDAAAAAQQAMRLGLLSLEQVQDAWDELGRKTGPAEEFLRFMERKGFLTPLQSSKLLKGDTEGYFLGGYRLLYKIASGSFGRVYRADDPNTGTVVAVKVLRHKWSDDKHSIELFEREAKLGISMRHPNVVQILAVNQDTASKQYYMVMEFVEGGNLRDFLTIRKKLEPLEALKILEEATAGLSYAFSRGLTHRDIKLTNILISSQRVAKLVDFGLAAANQTKGRDDTHVERTVDYAGLESATGVPPGDVRSDIFFLGCVFYELLSGRPPLPQTKDPKERMRKERFSNVPRLDPREVSGPPSLFRLVDTMMSLNAAQRLQTPSQLAEAIRDVRAELEGKPKGKPAANASPGGAATVSRSLFVVEKDEGLQNQLREKFKNLGYRVMIAGDPARALDRYRQHPYDALIIDVGTVGEEGLHVFDVVLTEAKRQRQFCAGIVILSENQREWVDKVESRECVGILVRPVNMKQLQQELTELLALAK